MNEGFQEVLPSPFLGQKHLAKSKMPWQSQRIFYSGEIPAKNAKARNEKRDLENRAREKRKSGQVTDDVAALKRNTHTTCGTRPKRRWRRRRLRFSTAFPCPCYYRFWWKWGEGKGKRRRQSSPTKFGTRVGKLHSGEESEYGNQNSERGMEWNYGLHVARYYDLAFLLFSCLQLLTHSSHTHPLCLRLSAAFFSGQPLKATNKKASS